MDRPPTRQEEVNLEMGQEPQGKPQGAPIGNHGDSHVRKRQKAQQQDRGAPSPRQERRDPFPSERDGGEFGESVAGICRGNSCIKIFSCAVCCVGIAVMLILILCGIRDLDEDEQLLVYSDPRETYNGPGNPWVSIITPTARRKSFAVGQNRYVLIRDWRNVTTRVQVGPGRFFLGPYEESPSAEYPCPIIAANQYVRIRDGLLGTTRTMQGPMVYVPRPLDEFELISAVTLSTFHYASVTNNLSGETRTVRGPILFFPGPFDSFEVGRAIVLARSEYVMVTNTLTGQARNVPGPTLFFPQSFERTAMIRNGTQLDADTAVLVRALNTGVLRLVTRGGGAMETGLYIPDPMEEIIEVRRLVRVGETEVAVVADAFGHLTYRSGNFSHSSSAQFFGQSFFVPANSHLVTFNWSIGGNLGGPTILIPKQQFLKVDLRARRTRLEIDRLSTVDNMNFEIGCDVFWQVLTVPTMIISTDDPPRDIWFRLRAQLAHALSNHTYTWFLSQARDIVEAVDQAEILDTSRYYAMRGLRLLNVDNVAIRLSILRHAF